MPLPLGHSLLRPGLPPSIPLALEQEPALLHACDFLVEGNRLGRSVMPAGDLDLLMVASRFTPIFAFPISFKIIIPGELLTWLWLPSSLVSCTVVNQPFLPLTIISLEVVNMGCVLQQEPNMHIMLTIVSAQLTQ